MTTVRPSPAFDIIVEFTSHLVKSIKDNVDTIATDLHSSNLLSESEYNHIVKLSSSDESFIRAVRTITAVRNKIERNPLLLDVFLDVLTKHGESVNKCVEKISQSCQQKVNGSITQVSGSHEPRFLCPFCQKCSVKKFLVSGCSSPYEEIDNLRFPFLNTTTLSRIERRSLEDNLITEFKEIKQSFQQLRHLLTGQNYRFREIKSLLLEYSCIADDPELLCANSIDDILDVVFEHASFFNYEFLEIIIAQFGSSSDNKHLQKFLSNLKTYCSRNSVEGPLCLSSTRYSNILFVALQLQNDKDLNLWQAKLLSHQLAKVVLKISRCEIQLVSVQDSGALIFSLAKNVFEKNFPVSIKKLESVGLSIVYSEVQSGLITVNGQCEKQSSLNQNIPMHQSPLLRTKLYQNGSSPSTGNGTSVVVPSITVDAVDGLEPIIEEGSNNGSVAVDAKNRRSKQRTAFKKRVDRPDVREGDWASSCLKCDYCSHTLPPGQHSMHQEKPYCNACYQILFGQEGFRKELLHSSDRLPRAKPIVVIHQSEAEKHELLGKISEYNMYQQSQNNSEELQPKEVNGVIWYEGVLKIYWGLKKSIQLAPGVLYAKAKNNRDSIHELVAPENCDLGNRERQLQVSNGWKSNSTVTETDSNKRDSVFDFVGMDDTAYSMMLEEAQKARARKEQNELLASLEPKTKAKEERNELMGSINPFGRGRKYRNELMASHDPSVKSSRDQNELMVSFDPNVRSAKDLNDMMATFDPSAGRSRVGKASLTCSLDATWNSPRKRSASFRRLSRKKRTSIRMDFSKNHSYIPPYGQSTNLRVSNANKTKDVLKILLDKYKVENDVKEFSLCVFYDNGHKELCKDDDYPLSLRLKLGPSEDIAKLFVIESSEVQEIISAEASQWIQFTIHELETFCTKYSEEERKEENRIRTNFEKWKEEIKTVLNCMC